MKLRKAARDVLLGILHILILSPKVMCSGVFELRLAAFINERGLNYEGNCCNGARSPTSLGTGPYCDLPCHTFFTFCLTHYMSHIPEDPSCTFGLIRTQVLGGNTVDFENVGGFSNPVTFQFNVTWPGTFSIIVESWHDSTLTQPKQGSPREKISRLAVQRHLQVGLDWEKYIQQTESTELEYKYRVSCSKNYYGPGCSILCRARDDQFGHYTCDEDGNKICMDKWKGDYCDQAICLEGCAEGQGYCNRPNECRCRSGWEGELCTECIVFPGCKNGTCSEPWQCTCNEGWGGMFCNQDLNYCIHHMPCKNGGICQNTGQGSYTCVCMDGFTGTNCEREIDDCITQPCLNGGVCRDIGSGYKCKCEMGFTGKRCDIVAETCSNFPNPCKNGAICKDGLDGYECICKTGYAGRNCDEEIYECAPNPCQNNGNCVDMIGGFYCECPSGFTGQYCEENLDDCAHIPCKNDAVCIDDVNSFQCRCVPGFVGKLCETNVDDCETRPCANGGSCKDLVNDFECTCRPGFTGKFCNYDIDECASNPCRNGASCTQSVDDYHCNCLSGFSGKNCQYVPGEKVTSTVAPTDIKTESTDSVKSTTEATPDNNNATWTEPQNAKESDALSKTELLLIVCLGVGIPLLLIIVVVTILLCRKRRLSHDTRKEEEENTQNSINNKLRESKIFTTIPQSSSTISNLTSKISNEEQDFNTLKSNKSNKSSHSRPSSQIYIGDKPINNKQLYYNKDLHIHSQHRDFEKTTKKLDKATLSIDPSNFDNRDYCSPHDIHIIGKTINNDALNRTSLLILEPPLHHEQLHAEPHRHSSYYGDDVLATEV